MERFKVLAVLICMISWGSAHAQIYEGSIGIPAADGLFDGPTGIVTDASGNIYVVDSENHRIQKFNSAGVFIKAWGTYGSEDGMFRNPTGIVISAAGEIFVTDSYNHRVQKFSTNGDFINKWGSYGNGNGQFSSPQGIVIDGNQNIYITDVDNNRVQKFNSSFVYQTKWGSPGSGTSQFSGPLGITVDNLGYVYVADTYNNRIQKFNTDGGFQTQWGISGQGDGQLTYPMGIKSDGNGNLFVVDYYRVQKFTDTGGFQGKWGSYGSGDGQFLGPREIFRQADGSFYVADFNNDRILKFNSTGGYVSKIGSTSNTDGRLKRPGGVAVDGNGNIYVVDTQNQRVQKFNSAGNFLAKWGAYGAANGQFNYPQGIAIDANGNVFVSDYQNRIQKFNSSGTFLLKWGVQGALDGYFTNPYGIAIDANGNLYVSDTGNNRVQKFTNAGVFVKKWGTTGSGNGQFNYPYGVATDPAGNVYVTDLSNARLQKFNSEGNFLAAWGTTGTSSGSSPYFVSIDAGGNLYVTDANDYSVRKFNSAGNFLLKWGTSGSGESQFHVPMGIATQGGMIYVVDSYNNRVQKFSILSVTSIPLSGAIGSSVVINGTGFSNTPSDHEVKFNGVVGTVTEAKPTKLTVTVPAGATTGKISVKRQDLEAASSTELLVLPLEIQQYSPSVSFTGEPVVISGKGFSSVNENNLVKINGIEAEVVSSSSTEITVIVPEEATSGKISVTVSGQTASSQTNILITMLRVTNEDSPDFFTVGDKAYPIHITVNEISKLKKVVFNTYGLCSPKKIKTQEINLSATTNSFTLEIPAQLFTDSLGIGGWLTYTDSDGLEVNSAKKVVYLRYPEDIPSAQIPNLSFGKEVKDYQIISIPLELIKSGTGTVFSDLEEADKKKWRLFSRIGDRYQENPGQIAPGVGYWLIVKERKDINPGEGNTVRATAAEPFKISLKPGWNLIGNPYNFTISWDDVIKQNPNVTLGKLIQYNNGTLKENQILERYRGALIKSESEIDVEIPIVNRNNRAGRVGSSRDEKIALDDDAWFIPLSLSDGNFTNALYGIGMHPRAKEQEDQWDETAAPLLNGFASFDWKMRLRKTTSLSKDFVATSKNYSWETLLTNHEPVTLSWSKTSLTTSDKMLVVDVDTQVEIVDMLSTSQLTLPVGEHKVKFHFGDEQYIKKQILGETIKVGTVFPNPMKRSLDAIQVGVNLPRETEGQLQILDNMGKMVRQSPNKKYDAGRYTLLWETDLQDLSPGLYHMKVLLGGHAFVRKILIPE